MHSFLHTVFSRISEDIMEPHNDVLECIVSYAEFSKEFLDMDDPP